MAYLDATQGARREGAASAVGSADLADDSVTSAKILESVIQSIQVALTAANIIAMRTTPVSLIPAPGAGKIVIVDSILAKVVRTATAFTGGGAVEFRYTDASGAKVSADLAASLITGAAGTAHAHVGGIEASITPVANAPIVITNADAVFAAGTGTANISISYRVITA
jgi:hypothetical protein